MTTPDDTKKNAPEAAPARRGGPRANDRGRSRGPRDDRGRASFDRPKPEFDQKIISIRRVTRVVSGGRRFSFSIAMVIGDKKGSVGLGTGKGGDTALAIGKALKAARKNMIKVSLTKTSSIPAAVDAKYKSSKVVINPNRGRGLVAGSSVRDVLVLAGIKDVTSKILSGSKNKLNNAQAALKALSRFARARAPKETESAEA